MHRIASLDLDDESDIDWKSLNDPAWDMWSGRRLQKKWRSLKATCNAADGIVSHRGEYNTSISHASFYLTSPIRLGKSPSNMGL
jgi:hypothetical protein